MHHQTRTLPLQQPHEGHRHGRIPALFFLLLLFLFPAVGASADPALIASTVENLTGYARTVGFEDAEAAASIATKMESHGLIVTQEPCQVRGPAGEQVTTWNVVGVKEGECNLTVVVCAHYDTSAPTCPGADDNAAGVAVMLETARLLRNEPFNRSVSFVAFSAEERGLQGSRAWLESDPERTDRIVAAINLDGVAYGDRIRILTFPGYSFRKYFPSSPEFVHQTGVCLSGDHRRFLEHQIPAVLVTDTGDHSFWDTPDDTIERLNFSLAAWCADGVAFAVQGLADGEEVNLTPAAGPGCYYPLDPDTHAFLHQAPTFFCATRIPRQILPPPLTEEHHAAPHPRTGDVGGGARPGTREERDGTLPGRSRNDLCGDERCGDEA